MKRFWIWMIPILAAISAVWLQAALHGYDPAGVTRAPATPSARHATMNISTITPISSENAVNTSSGPAEQPH
jgi:hypothetical protein